MLLLSKIYQPVWVHITNLTLPGSECNPSPGPDASCHFDHAVAAAEAGHRRLWGAEAGELFAEVVAAAAGGGEDCGEDAGRNEGGGSGGGDDDEDELEALLRNIPGQPSTMDTK
jgi:hypothetical protein